MELPHIAADIVMGFNTAQELAPGERALHKSCGMRPEGKFAGPSVQHVPTEHPHRKTRGVSRKLGLSSKEAGISGVWLIKQSVEMY